MKQSLQHSTCPNDSKESQPEVSDDAGGKVASELAIPLRVEKRTIGVLDMGSSSQRFFTSEIESNFARSCR